MEFEALVDNSCNIGSSDVLFVLWLFFEVMLLNMYGFSFHYLLGMV